MEEERGRKNDVFELIEGLKPVDQSAVESFQKGMKEQVIPDILRIVEERRTLAAQSGLWQLKC